MSKRKLKSVSGKKVAVPRPFAAMPQIEQVLRTRWKMLGFVTAAAVEEPVTRGNLLSAVVLATTTTQVARIFMSVLVKRVRMWQVESSSTNPLGQNTLTSPPAVLWESDAGPIIQKISVPLGTALGYVDTAPPKDSFASYWSLSGINETDTLFRFSGTVGTVIQIDMECCLNDSTVTAVTGVSSGRTVGEVYYAIGSKISFFHMNP